MLRTSGLSPGRVVQLAGASPWTLKGCGFNCWSGQLPRPRILSPATARTRGNRSMFLSHIHATLSLPPSLSKIVIRISWGEDLKRKSGLRNKTLPGPWIPHTHLPIPSPPRRYLLSCLCFSSLCSASLPVDTHLKEAVFMVRAFHHVQMEVRGRCSVTSLVLQLDVWGSATQMRLATECPIVSRPSTYSSPVVSSVGSRWVLLFLQNSWGPLPRCLSGAQRGGKWQSHVYTTLLNCFPNCLYQFMFSQQNTSPLGPVSIIALRIVRPFQFCWSGYCKKTKRKQKSNPNQTTHEAPVESLLFCAIVIRAFVCLLPGGLTSLFIMCRIMYIS